MKKLLLTSAAASLLALPVAPVLAEDSPMSWSANVGLFNDYLFRGVSQTGGEPAVQGGFDFGYAAGPVNLYAGTWASNVSWLEDAGLYTNSSLEWDFYGGYRGTFGKSDFGYDVGLLQYYYPGTHSTIVAPGSVKADTLEAYAAISWKWLSAKYSQSLGSKTFGVDGSRGTSYLDISANYPLNDKLSIQAHYGNQSFKGTTPGATVSNDANASYEDYKLGLTYALPKDFTLGAYYTTTSMDATQKAFYTNASDNRMVGKDAFVVFVQKTF